MGKLPKRIYRPYYLGDWLRVTGRDRKGAAQAADVDISYVNNMIGGRKPNPSAHVLLAISEYLGITINDLYRRPPSEASVTAVGSLSPTARATLLDRARRK